MADTINKKLVFTVDDSDIQKTTKKIDKLFGEVSKRGERLDKLYQSTMRTSSEQMKSAGEQVRKQMKDLKRQLADLPSATGTQYRKLNQQLKEAAFQHQAIKENIGDVQKTIRDSYLAPFEELSKRFEKLADQGKDIREGFHKMGFEVAVEDIEDAEGALRRIMERVAKLDDKSEANIKAAINEELAHQTEVHKKQEKMLKRQGSLLEAASEDAGELYKGHLEDAISKFGINTGPLKDFLKLRKATAAKAPMWAKQLQEKGAGMAGKPGAGVMGKGFGKVIGQLGSLIGKLGPLVGIIGGLAAFVKVLIDAESQAKELNKALLESGIAGRDLMNLAGSARGATEAFNDLRSQYTENISANLRWMKTAQDQIRLLGELTSAGVSLKNVTQDQNLSARSLTDTLLTYSTLFAASTGEIAKVSSDFTLEFLQSQDQIRRSLSTVAAAAQNSGMSANRFFSTVQSITSQMGLFNVTLGGTAKLLADVSSRSAFGAKVAEDAVGEVSKRFTEEQFLTTFAFIESQGGLKQMSKVLRADLTKANEEAEKLRRKGVKEGDPQLTKLNLQINQLTELQKSGFTNFEDLYAYLTGPNASQQATVSTKTLGILGALAEATGKSIDTITKGDVESAKAQGILGTKLSQMLGFNQEQVQALVAGIFANKEQNEVLGDVYSAVSKSLEQTQTESEREKQARADLAQAQEIARNTASVTTAIEIGVTYFLEKIYDIIRTIAKLIMKIPGVSDAQTIALMEIEDQIAAQRDEMRATKEKIRDAEQAVAFGTKEEKKEATAFLKQLKENNTEKNQQEQLKELILSRKNVQQAIESLKTEGIELNEENIRAAVAVAKEGGSVKGMKAEKLVKEGAKATTRLWENQFKAEGKTTEELKKLLEEERRNMRAANMPPAVQGQIQKRVEDYQNELAKRGQAEPATAYQMPGSSMLGGPVPTAKDAFGISSDGYLPFQVSAGDIVVQKDSLIEAMRGPAGAALTNVETGAARAAGGGGTIHNTININGGDLGKVRQVVFNVLRQYEDQQKV